RASGSTSSPARLRTCPSTSGSRTGCSRISRLTGHEKRTGSSFMAPRRERAAISTWSKASPRGTGRATRSREHVMRVDLGPAAADLLFVLAGLGVVNAVGFLRSSLLDVFAAIGLAFLAGVCFVMTLAIALLTIGVPFRLPAFIAVSLATPVVGLLSRRGWGAGVTHLPARAVSGRASRTTH